MKEFKIGDIVEQNGHNEALLVVTGYIHDSERLFVVDPTDRINHGKEFEMWSGEVTRHLRELPNAEAHGRRSRTVQPLVGGLNQEDEK